MSFKVTFRIEAASGQISADMEHRRSIPFLPREGDIIAPIKDGEFHKVEGVYWSDNGGFEVFLECAEISAKTLTAIGWRYETPA